MGIMVVVCLVSDKKDGVRNGTHDKYHWQRWDIDGQMGLERQNGPYHGDELERYRVFGPYSQRGTKESSKSALTLASPYCLSIMVGNVV